jgi:hypothetical protein
MVDVTESAWATASGPIEVLFYVDDDDRVSIEAAKSLDCRAVVGPRITLSACYNETAKVAKGNILHQCCDSVIFETPGWDVLVAAEFAKVKDKILLVFGRDGIHDGGGATLPFIHRRWMETIGRFVPPYFSCDFCDTWNYEIAQSLGRAVYLPTILTLHRHPLAGTAPLDQTHLERMARGEADDVEGLFHRLAPERAAEAELLRAVMR